MALDPLAVPSGVPTDPAVRQATPTPDPVDTKGDWKAILYFYTLLVFMVFFQMGVVWAKKFHPKRFDQVTLVGLWLVPFLLALSSGFWRFCFVWFLWSCVTGYMLRLAMQKPIATTTPRRIYAWFLMSHRITMPVATLGVLLIVGNFLGLGSIELFFFSVNMQLSLFWYGVYFGVLTRDMAEVSSDLMAGTMGVGKSTQGHRLGFSMNQCGICSGQLQGATMRAGEELQPGGEGHVRLPCKHAFHDYCIRGWTMVGKKDMCPTCLEKVDLRHLHADRPWERMNVVWGQMLDLFRYLVVWFPVLILTIHLTFYELGILPPNPHSDKTPPAPTPAASLGMATPAATPVATPAATATS